MWLNRRKLRIWLHLLKKSLMENFIFVQYLSNYLSKYFRERISFIFHKKQSSRGVLRKDVLKNFAKFSGKHLCQSLLFNKVAGLRLQIKKETLAQVLSCKFWYIFKDTFFYRTPLVAACVSFWFILFTTVID